MKEPCARCGMLPAVEGSPMCKPCGERGPLTPVEARRWRARRDPPEREPADPGFEGHGDFSSSDPYERYIAHQAAKGRL